MLISLILLWPLLLVANRAVYLWTAEPIDLVAWGLVLGWTVAAILIALVMVISVFWS